MKKLFVYSFAIAALSMVLVGCGEKEDALKPETTKIKGKLSNCFEVVEREYSVNPESYDDGMLYIELKRTSSPLPDELKDANKVGGTYYGTVQSEYDYGIEWECEILDEKGNILDKPSPDGYSNEIKSLLALAEGETSTITITIYDFQKDEKYKKASMFRLVSIVKQNTSKKSEEKEATASSESGTNGGIEIILPSTLKGKVEVVENDYKIQLVDNKQPKINITFKLLETVDPSTFQYQMFNADAQDSNGRTVSELGEHWGISYNMEEKFKNFLADDPGRTCTLEVYGTASENTSEDIKKVKKIYFYWEHL